MGTKKILLGMIAASVVAPLTAGAAMVTYDFTGSVVQAQSSQSSLSASAPVGTNFTGSFTLDDSFANTSTFPSFSTYSGALVSGRVDYGSFAIIESAGAVSLQAPPAFNQLSMVSGSAFGVGGSVTTSGLPGFSGVGWDLQLTSNAGTAFNTQKFPTTDLVTNLALYDSRIFNVLVNDGTYNYGISGTVDSITLAPVPLPGAACCC